MSELALPEGWLKKELSVLTQVITKGTTPTTLGYTYQHSGVNFLKVENIGDNKIDLKSINQYISDEANDALKRSQLVESDILFSIAGTIGKTALVSKEHLPMNTNQAIAIIRGSDSSLVPDFLKYQLQNFIEIIKLKSRGGAMNNVSLKDLKEFEVTVPAIAEQKEVVRFLDTHLTTVSQIQARLDAIPKLIEKFRHSVLSDAVSGKLTEEWRETNNLEFDWENKKLGSIAKEVKYGLTTSATDVDTGIKFVRITDLHNNNINWKSVPYCEATIEEVEKYKLSKGDLLFARTGATVGKSYLLKKDPKNAVFASYLIKVSMGNEHNEEYLELFFQSLNYWSQISTLKSGIGQPSVNGTKLKGLLVPLPTLDEQNEIVNKAKKLLEVANNIENTIATAKARVDNLTQSILHQAFTGNLTQEWREQHPELISGENSAEALLAKIKAEKQGSGKKKSSKG